MKQVIAACQLTDVQDDNSKTIEAIAHYAAQADHKGVTVLCFPECYLQGYTRVNTLAGKRAIDISSEKFKSLLKRLSKYKTTIILGLIERSDSQLFNTAVVIKDGKFIGKYRKTHPNEDIFVAGNEYPAFSTDSLKFGINICNDANYPEAAAELLKAGPQVIFYPLNNRLATQTAEKWHDKHIKNLIDRANQTKCWIVSSDIIHKDDKSIGYGFTAIVSPEGEIVAQAEEFTEQMVTASI